MKVKELLKELEGLDPELEVLVSRDAEGNDHKKLWTTALGTFEFCDNQIQIGLHPDDLTEEMRKAGYSEEDVIEDGLSCIILWPED